MSKYSYMYRVEYGRSFQGVCMAFAYLAKCMHWCMQPAAPELRLLNFITNVSVFNNIAAVYDAAFYMLPIL